MKHHHNHNHPKTAEPPLMPVCFEFTHPTAACVCVAGTFNDWKPETRPMHSLGGGRWAKETFLAPGTYEYRLVVDGEWINDPMAKETVANSFGGENSLLRVTGTPNETHLANAELAPLKTPNQ
jgi:1,4-alpha-glucan branching enzyme